MYVVVRVIKAKDKKDTVVIALDYVFHNNKHLLVVNKLEKM